MNTVISFRRKTRVIELYYVYILESSDTNFTIEIGNEITSDQDKILEDLWTMWGIVDVAQMHTQDLLDGYEVRSIKISNLFSN